jgi:hypothetical protein
VCTIIKPNAPPAKGSLVKTLPSKIILLKWEGQETAWRETYHYSIEIDLNFIAERTSNTSWGLSTSLREV